MSFFKSMKASFRKQGLAEDRLLRKGTSGTAVITSAEKTGVGTAVPGAGAQPVYQLRLRVRIPGRDPYDVEHHQWTFDSLPPRAGQVVSVKVNLDAPDDLVVDWRHPPTGATSRGASVADILATGVPGRATVREIFETGVVAPDNGDPVVGFVLDVRLDGLQPYQLRFGHRVPVALRDRVMVGAVYPVKALPPDPNEVAIDWAAAF